MRSFGAPSTSKTVSGTSPRQTMDVDGPRIATAELSEKPGRRDSRRMVIAGSKIDHADSTYPQEIERECREKGLNHFLVKRHSKIAGKTLRKTAQDERSRRTPISMYGLLWALTDRVEV